MNGYVSFDQSGVVDGAGVTARRVSVQGPNLASGNTNQGGSRDITNIFNQQLQSTNTFFNSIDHIYDSLDPVSRSIAKLTLFAQLVKANAPFDLKVHGYSQRDIGTYSIYNGQTFRYDDYGNYNFGVAARAFGLSLNMATFGAGIYQIKTGTEDWSNIKGWFDDPRDTQMIINGYNATIK